jgi:elongation factor P
VTVPFILLPDTDIIENICENEKDLRSHFRKVGAAFRRPVEIHGLTHRSDRYQAQDVLRVRRRPYVCVDVEVSKPTARGGQTLVRLKMRNLITRAVFDKTFKAGEKFAEPDLSTSEASFLYADSAGFHFMDQESFETLTLSTDVVGDDRKFLTDNMVVQLNKLEGRPFGLQLPTIVELTIASTEPAVRGDTASGGATKAATLETGLEIRVPLFIKEGEKVKVHTETREFAGRA